MMKNIIKRITATLLLLIICSSISCTHNNGDIGPLFGKWKLVTLEIDGVPDVNYAGNIFFGFQNDVTNMILIDNNNNTDQRFGRWTLSGDRFEIIYDEPNFSPYPQIYFKKGMNLCKMVTITDKDLVFTMDVDEHIYTYKFIKW